MFDLKSDMEHYYYITSGASTFNCIECVWFFIIGPRTLKLDIFICAITFNENLTKSMVSYFIITHNFHMDSSAWMINGQIIYLSNHMQNILPLLPAYNNNHINVYRSEDAQPYAMMMGFYSLTFRIFSSQIWIWMTGLVIKRKSEWLRRLIKFVWNMLFLMHFRMKKEIFFLIMQFN